jgi:hypothetical protein
LRREGRGNVESRGYWARSASITGTMQAFIKQVFIKNRVATTGEDAPAEKWGRNAGWM